MRKEFEKMIPDQRIGSRLDTTHEVEAESMDEAKRVFDVAAARLLDVNIWEKICGPLSAKFSLTDNVGNGISRPAQPGDHFRIDIPGPGSSAGDGFDWVEVEAVDDKRDHASKEESVTIRVRPSASPLNANQDVAHFLKDHATSSFRIARSGNLVRAEVHGRNEVPNTDVENPLDKGRNAAVGGGAIAGVAKPQWNSLVRGLLDHVIKE